MESDEDDFVFYGTPIEREEDITTRKKKALAEASGQLRTLPPWKQEVRDEEGRRRFHGAFSGGFSAGYYNSVGSKEGWIPQTFTSSRKNRAEIKQQSILNFMDEDEKTEMEGNSLGTSMQFDTFGSTAAELARKQAEKEQQQRPSTIPGPVPEEIVLPATDSIGVNLLLKMGWRRGRSIRDSRLSSLYDARREARKAFLALSSEDVRAPHSVSHLVEGDLDNITELPTEDENQLPKSTPVYVLNPKQDLHGLGYDPFRNAPEFRERKRSRISGNREIGQGKPSSIKDSLFGFKSGRVAPGFGIGALEELDTEDEDVYASGYDFRDTYVQEIEEPARLALEDKKKKGEKELGILPGFKVASFPDYQLERFDPPVIPKDFVPRHKFPAPLEAYNKFADTPPLEVPPPEDKNLKILIEGVATLVARCGKLFEDISREKNQSNPLFSFLNGGNGHDYYTRKLWEERQKHKDQSKQQFDGKMLPSEQQKMTAESRGRILGEKPLERSSKDLGSSVISVTPVNLQVNLSDTFTAAASFSEPPEVAKPFRDNPAKQQRFEQYLREKYRGGLRSKDSGGASYMSEADRARERLEFESAAVAIEKGKWGKETKDPNQQLLDLSGNTGLQFTSGGVEQVKISQAEELIMKKMYPKREEFQWHPASVLCKRFDLIDPYMGKPPPAPRMRSKMDSLIFMPDMVKAAKSEETATISKVPPSVPQFDGENINEEVADGEIEVELEVENVERPVDLYKAIFSDDSDDEEENSSLNQVEQQQKNTEAANSTLSRLIAGDFLESLGKELGLEVPPEQPHSEKKARDPPALKETINSNKGDNNANTLLAESKFPSNYIAVSESHKKQVIPRGNPYQEASSDGGLRKHEVIDGNTHKSGSQIRGPGTTENNFVKSKLEKVSQEQRKTITSMGRHDWNNSSSEERGRNRSRHNRHKSSKSDEDTTESSDDSRDRHHSRSGGRKSSSRKHSKHHKHISGHSSRSSSHHNSKREHGKDKREKQKWKD